MPQATQELVDYWGGVDDAPVIAHLEASGYVLNPDWTWSPPAGVTLANMPEKDWMAVLFLVQEWDFGGVKAS